jgi:uncharacterized membrane protein
MAANTGYSVGPLPVYVYRWNPLDRTANLLLYLILDFGIRCSTLNSTEKPIAVDFLNGAFKNQRWAYWEKRCKDLQMLVFLPLTTFFQLVPSAEAQVATSTINTWDPWIVPFMHAGADLAGIAAVCVMLWGFLRAIWSFIGSELRRKESTDWSQLRSRLGYFILFGLELLIIADIIETITAPNYEHVLVLGLIVLIRTVISFSLNWELGQEAKHKGRTDPSAGAAGKDGDAI